MLDELGRGGFATVYKVRHNELGYIRAIRVLNETVVDSSSPTYRKFLRECKVLLRLGNGNHPNIVHIYQPRLLENKALVEMDYVDGQDIMHYLKQNQNFVPVEEVIRMAEQMSSALAYCHEDIYRFCMDRDLDNLQDDPNDGSKVLMDENTRQRLIAKYKVIHNDIHSGNIMRREDGNFVLLDFGLAINGEEVVRSSRRKNGAPEFKAPEKWDNESILSEQSDIYSFGIVLYQYLAGRVPFPYNTAIGSYKAEFEIGEAHQKATPPSIETLRKEFFERKYKGKKYEKDYPQWLEDVILKCLQKDPAERFMNGKELFAAITAGIARMSNDERDSLRQTVAALEQEKDNMQQRLRQEKDDLQSEKNELWRLSANIEAERNRLSEEQAGFQKRVVGLEAERERLKVEQSAVKKQNELLAAEWDRLRKEQKRTSSSAWKWVSGVLLLLLLAAGGYLLYSANNESSDDGLSDSTAELEEKNHVLDSLQQENGRLRSEIDSLLIQWSTDNSGVHEREEYWRKQYENAIEERDQNKKQSEQYKQERDQNKKQSEQYKQERDRYKKQSEQYKQERDRYKKQSEQYRQERDQYRQQRDQYKAQLGDSFD